MRPLPQQLLFGCGIKPKHIRHPSPGLAEQDQLVDKVRVQAGLTSTHPVERTVRRFRPGRGQGKMQGLPVGIPVRIRLIFPLPKPFQSVPDMPNLIAINSIQYRGGLAIPCFTKAFGIITTVVQVGLLEGQAQAGDEIHGGLHGFNRPPEIAAQRYLPEIDPAGLHAIEIEAGMHLLLFQGLENALAKFLWCVGKLKQNQGHELGRQQFMVGEKM